MMVCFAEVSISKRRAATAMMTSVVLLLGLSDLVVVFGRSYTT